MGLCISCLKGSDTSKNDPGYATLLDDCHEIKIDMMGSDERTNTKILQYSPNETPMLTGAIAILLASKFCRESKLYRWREEMLHNIGRRGYKYSFLIDFLDLSGSIRSTIMLSVLPNRASPITITNDASFFKLKSLLIAIKHPFLVPLTDIYFSKEKKAFVILHPFYKEGSLKDRIHGKVDPTFSYVRKYQAYNRTPIPLKEIALYGRHILEGLSALRKKDIICHHLYTSNIMMDNGIARISEIELTILGMDRYTEWKDLTLPMESKVPLDILLFGHVLYEMAFAEELLKPVPYSYELEELDHSLKEVMEMIFYPNENMIELEDLLQHPFFFHIEVATGQSIRLDSQMKNSLKNCLRINESRRLSCLKQYQERQAFIEEKNQQQEDLKAEEEMKILDHAYKQRKQRKSSTKSHRRSSYRSQTSISNSKEEILMEKTELIPAN